MEAAPYAALATLAGAGRRGRVDGHRADRAYFDAPRDAVALPNGDVVITDGAALRVLSLASDAVTTLQTLPFLAPRGPTVIDGGAGLVVADAGHHKLRLLQLAYTAAGVSVVQDVTLAGTGRQALTDGPADAAEFCRPSGVCVLADGSLLVSDAGNHALRRVHGRPGRPGLVVTTVVGGGGAGHADGGPGTARLSSPGALALDSATGVVLVADVGNRCVRALHPPPDDALVSGLSAKELPPGSWALTTLAPSPSLPLLLGEPAGLLVAPDGRLLVADAAANVLRLLEPAAGDDADARAAPPSALHTLLGDAPVCVLRAAAGTDAAATSAAAGGGGGAAAPPAATAVLPPRLLQRYHAAASPAEAAAIAQRLRGILPAAPAAGRPQFQFSGAPSPTGGFPDAAASAAVTRLQAECRAAVVVYHDVARLAALHARFATASVLAGAPPPLRSPPVSGASKPHGQQLGRGAARGAGPPHAVPPAFVRVQQARTAASAAAGQLYADGSPPSEARLRRPAGMCLLPQPDLPGCVAVCDGGNALIRLLVSTEAAASEAAAPALGRLVPPELLTKAAATARRALADAAAARAVAEAAAAAAASRHATQQRQQQHQLQQREAAAAAAARAAAAAAPPPRPPASLPAPGGATAARNGVKPQAPARGRTAGAAAPLAATRRQRAPSTSVATATAAAGKPLHVHGMRATAVATALLQQAASIAATVPTEEGEWEADGTLARGDTSGLQIHAGDDDGGGAPSESHASTAAAPSAQSPPPSRASRQQQLLLSPTAAAASDLDFLAALSLEELVPPSPQQQPPPPQRHQATRRTAVDDKGVDPRDVRSLLAELHGHLTPEQARALQQALLEGESEGDAAGGGGIASASDRAERWAKLRARAVTPSLTSSIARRRDGAGSLPPAPRANGASATVPSPLPRVGSAAASVTSSSFVVTSRVGGGSGGSVAGGSGSASGPVYAAGAEPRLVRSGALSASFLAEQLCPSRNAYTSPAVAAQYGGAAAAAAGSRDALAAEDAGPAAQAVRAYLAQLQQQPPAAAAAGSKAEGAAVGAASKRLLQARFTHHTAASATRTRVGGRPAVHAAPAFLNLTGVLGNQGSA